MEFSSFIKQAASVKPNKRQLNILRETPFYAFVHFSPNTFTDLEWGLGDEDPAIFNPTKLDCEQWARAIKEAGMKGMVLTAKHHDGFCLWQSKYTKHCMKNSPYKNGKGDIVAEAAEACRKYGLKFGFYLSPWDRNSKYYGTDEYNTYYKNQLTELLTNYGEIFYVWFDGACGEGPNGRKQVYDFDGYFELIRKYQPNATFFHDCGEIRWCGNEAGKPSYAQWSVVPHELCRFCEIQTGAGPLHSDGALSYMYNSDTNIGEMSNIAFSEGLVFAPAETDMSIRPGWFYHKNEEPHSLERLFNTYLNTVGNNTTFHMNIPPTPEGLFDERDIRRLGELGDLIKNELGTDLAADAEIVEKRKENTDLCEFVIKLPEKRKIKYLELAEKIAEGQRVESFIVYYKNSNNVNQSVCQCNTIGSRKIVKFDEEIETDEITVKIVSARDTVLLEWIKMY